MKFAMHIVIATLLGLPFLSSAQTLTNPKVPKEFAAKYYFNQSQEFPNLFLPEIYRHMPPDQVPRDVVLASRELVEKAFQSVLNRTAWKMTLPGEEKSRDMNLFHYLQTAASQIDPGAKIYPSAGLMRSMFSYLYEQMYEARRNGEMDSQKVLQAVIDSKAVIPSYEVRGVGSDLDVLVEAKDPAKADQVKMKVHGIINYSFAIAFGDKQLSRSSLGMARSTFLQGDVKDLGKQIARSASQGGSTLDWLAYDLEAGKFKEPARDPHVIDNFVRGYFSFFKPEQEMDTLEHAATTIRGIRPLLELPFLKMSGQDQFENELAQISEEINKGNKVASHDLTQFAKMFRNSFHGGANNRIWRGAPGSLESKITDFGKLIREKAQTSRLLPIFASTEAHKKTFPGDDLPARLLMDNRHFIAGYTDNGYLYHGTPVVDNILSILKSGMHISDHTTGNGRSVFGRGVYFTKDFAIVEQHLKGNNLDKDAFMAVLKLKLKDPKNLRVLSWGVARNDPYIQELEKWCAQVGVNIFEYLDKVHHIDVILNEHMVVQNTSIFDFKDSFQQIGKSFVQAQVKQLRAKMVKADSTFVDVENLSILLEMAKEVGEDSLTRQAFKVEVQKNLEVLSRRSSSEFGDSDVTRLLYLNGLAKFLSGDNKDNEVAQQIVERLALNRGDLVFDRLAQIAVKSPRTVDRLISNANSKTVVPYDMVLFLVSNGPIDQELFARIDKMIANGFRYVDILGGVAHNYHNNKNNPLFMSNLKRLIAGVPQAERHYLWEQGGYGMLFVGDGKPSLEEFRSWQHEVPQAVVAPQRVAQVEKVAEAAALAPKAPAAKAPPAQKVSNTDITALAQEIAGARDSFKVTGLLEKLSKQKLSDQEKSEVLKIYQDFAAIRTPIKGYSYIQRSFSSLLGAQRVNLAGALRCEAVFGGAH